MAEHGCAGDPETVRSYRSITAPGPGHSLKYSDTDDIPN